MTDMHFIYDKADGNINRAKHLCKETSQIDACMCLPRTACTKKYFFLMIFPFE